ncbi:DUF6270 domain-containing protein [Cytobacillus purgationiresistens]|uniref:Uncharacterized protein n=1 Tax=Cytobacillus purgationiresistens TaxID=863449 RepID=A0ABU0AD20_9BACI|nr:DUF6270 domain-containing protein [Cytobacillus purgationiresistens]MDQ0269155.1 hypothetical protein [Cytobacillus purgationiresistens]
MRNIAVLGSCVSRDGFNSQFIPDYKNYYSCILHQNQMSMISLAGDAFEFNEELIDNLKPFDARHFKTELDKSFLNDIKKANPEYLIIDFYGDIYYGVQEIGESWITNKKWLFSQTTLYPQLDTKRSMSLQNNYDEYLEKWKVSVDKFFDFLSKELPSCRVILNKARFIDDLKDEKTGEIVKISETEKHRKINVDYYNDLWDTLDDYVTSNFDVEILDFSEHTYVSVENHPWGMFYVHYDPSFYKHFTEKLMNIILKDINSYTSKLENKISAMKETKGETPIVFNFKGKVSKSRFNNPNYTAYRKNLKTLGDPYKDFKGESLTGTYDVMSVKNGKKVSVLTKDADTIAQRINRFNISSAFEAAGTHHSRTDSFDHIGTITINWWGDANGIDGDLVEMAVWDIKENNWKRLTSDFNHQVEKTSSHFSCHFLQAKDFENYIDERGNVQVLSFSSPASESLPSIVDTDYIEITMNLI